MVYYGWATHALHRVRQRELLRKQELVHKNTQVQIIT